MKLTYSPFMIIDKNRKALDYQAGNLIDENLFRKEYDEYQTLYNLENWSTKIKYKFLIHLFIFFTLIK